MPTPTPVAFALRSAIIKNGRSRELTQQRTHARFTRENAAAVLAESSFGSDAADAARQRRLGGDRRAGLARADWVSDDLCLREPQAVAAGLRAAGRAGPRRH